MEEWKGYFMRLLGGVEGRVVKGGKEGKKRKGLRSKRSAGRR